MAGNVKLMTSAGGGVILDTATTTATDVTVKVPVTGVNNGTLVCSDSSGNVGIGTSTSLSRVTALGTSSTVTNGASTRNPIASIRGGNDNNRLDVYVDNSGGTAIMGLGAYNVSGGGTAMAFYTGASVAEAMRIDSSGNLLVNTTSNPITARLHVTASGGNHVMGGQVGVNGNYVLGAINASGSVVGGVVANASSTSFPTSSDYRLKENIQPMQGALDTVAQLNPVTYTWKADGSDGQGFIAHELQAVVPDCVTGEKDAVDAEGKPVYQGIDTSFLVATLTKAIQEQQEQINELKAEVAALKGI